jgi:biotin synthase
MCYVLPAEIVAIDKIKNIGTVDYFGEKRNVLLDLDDVQIGDYIYAQGGVMVRKLDKAEALEILEVWKDLFLELKRKDQELSKVDEKDLPANILEVLQKVNLKKILTKPEVKTLFGIVDPKELEVMCEVANHVRQRTHGNSCCVHGIIEFSNHCSQNCYYCGIRQDKQLNRYRMSVDEIVAAAKDAVDKYNFKALCLQSGEDLWYNDDKLEEIVKKVRDLGVLVFISIGSRSIATYQRLYNAGARAALLRFETSNQELFAKLRPGTKSQDRINLIKAIKDMGYILSTGFIVALPEQTEEDIINSLFLTKELKADMYSFGPLIPTIGTPLADAKKITAETMLKVIAATRFINPDANILITTALETLSDHAKRDALFAGGNSLMIDVTPVKFQEMYKIYDNKASLHSQTGKIVQDTIDLLASLGRAPTDLGI